MKSKFQSEFKHMVRTSDLSLLTRTSDCAPAVELHQSFPSKIQTISPFVDQLMRFIAKFRNVDESDVDIEMALREALANAIIHGNREDPHKRVYVTCRCTPDGEVSITVQDEGQGFDTSAVPDPTAPENRLLTAGRGIYLMKRLMDEVRFEQGGAAVYMCKKSNASSGQKGTGMTRTLANKTAG
jgi:serine/threonine-protein kinase RsbW